MHFSVRVWAFIDTVMNRLVPCKAGKLLTSPATIRLSRGTPWGEILLRYMSKVPATVAERSIFFLIRKGGGGVQAGSTRHVGHTAVNVKLLSPGISHHQDRVPLLFAD
jgi:hypothetical protein